jgi:hypothetical protein
VDVMFIIAIFILRGVPDKRERSAPTPIPA